MSGLTLTAGLSFSGGFTFTEAPPQNTAAWFAGGGQDAAVYWRSTVQRITFATDTATAVERGPLSRTMQYLAAASNLTDGWFGGGNNGPDGGNGSTVGRITYATDTATASVRGPLTSPRAYLAAAGNTTNAWFGGGAVYSTVDRITYATETATASLRGPLSSARFALSAAGNTTDTWFASGGNPGTEALSTVDRITYATDTDTASVRGPLSLARSRVAAAGNSDYGWFGGGNTGGNGGSGAFSIIDRITYATDTATASVRGPLSGARYALAAAGNSDYGWFGGGGDPAAFTPTGPTTSTIIHRITYATDTATAAVRGPLSSGRTALAGAGGIQ